MSGLMRPEGRCYSKPEARSHEPEPRMCPGQLHSPSAMTFSAFHTVRNRTNGVRRVLRERKRYFKQSAVKDLRGVVPEPNGLGLTGAAHSDDLIVCRALATSRQSGHHVRYAREFLEHRFHSPETSAG